MDAEIDTDRCLLWEYDMESPVQERDGRHLYIFDRGLFLTSGCAHQGGC